MHWKINGTNHNDSTGRGGRKESITTAQSGTEDPLLDLVSDLQDTRARKSDKDPLVILLDFEKALDKVDPWILLRVFLDKGIPVYLLRWFRSFLLDRRYYVCVGTSYSKIVRFALGVPHGSISRPLLFALYLSTLTTEIGAAVNHEVRTVEYADDVNIWLRLRKNADNSYDTTQAQTALNVISTWIENNGINVSISDSINDTKTYGFIYTANQCLPPLRSLSI